MTFGKNNKIIRVVSISIAFCFLCRQLLWAYPADFSNLRPMASVNRTEETAQDQNLADKRSFPDKLTDGIPFLLTLAIFELNIRMLDTFPAYEMPGANLVAPIIEEIIFRKYIFKEFLIKQRKLSIYRAVLISSLVFGIGDTFYGVVGVPFGILGGFFFALVYVKTNSLLLPIALHMSNNWLAKLVNILPRGPLKTLLALIMVQGKGIVSLILLRSIYRNKTGAFFDEIEKADKSSGPQRTRATAAFSGDTITVLQKINEAA